MRKFDPSIWNNGKFRSFSDDAKLAYLFLITHPAMTPVGAMRASIDGLAAEMGWEKERMDRAVSETVEKGMVVVDRQASFLAIKDYLRYNAPDGPNAVVRAWPEAFGALPDCEAKRQLAMVCVVFLKKRGNWSSFLSTQKAAQLFETLASYAEEEPQSPWDQGIDEWRSRRNHAPKEGPKSSFSEQLPPEKNVSPPNSPDRRPKPAQEDAEPSSAERRAKKPKASSSAWIDRLQAKHQTKQSTLLKENFVVPSDWIKAACTIRPDLPEDYIESTTAANFVRYFSSRSGESAYSRNWFALWMKWCTYEKFRGMSAKLDFDDSPPVSDENNEDRRAITLLGRAEKPEEKAVNSE